MTDDNPALPATLWSWRPEDRALGLALFDGGAHGSSRNTT